jgi:hypothetical protein
VPAHRSHGLIAGAGAGQAAVAHVSTLDRQAAFRVPKAEAPRPPLRGAAPPENLARPLAVRVLVS